MSYPHQTSSGSSPKLLKRMAARATTWGSSGSWRSALRIRVGGYGSQRRSGLSPITEISPEICPVISPKICPEICSEFSGDFPGVLPGVFPGILPRFSLEFRPDSCPDFCLNSRPGFGGLKTWQEGVVADGEIVQQEDRRITARDSMRSVIPSRSLVCFAHPTLDLELPAGSPARRKPSAERPG
jgi:hypothetical protein